MRDQAAKNPRKCLLRICDEPHLAMGWCRKHYLAWKKYGHPLKRAHEVSRDDSLAYRFWSGVAIGDGIACWEWRRRRSSGGHGGITVKGRETGTHRVAWELANGPIPDGLWVLHLCDNAPCCNPAHLYLGTPHDNLRDQYDRGGRIQVGRSGEANPRAKLTADAVAQIRTAYNAQRGQLAALARQYGVSDGTIRKVVDGTTWRVGLLNPPGPPEKC